MYLLLNLPFELLQPSSNDRHVHQTKLLDHEHVLYNPSDVRITGLSFQNECHLLTLLSIDNLMHFLLHLLHFLYKITIIDHYEHMHYQNIPHFYQTIDLELMLVRLFSIESYHPKQDVPNVYSHALYLLDSIGKIRDIVL